MPAKRELKNHTFINSNQISVSASRHYRLWSTLLYEDVDIKKQAALEADSEDEEIPDEPRGKKGVKSKRMITEDDDDFERETPLQSEKAKGKAKAVEPEGE
jgi:hypothetical protein